MTIDRTPSSNESGMRPIRLLASQVRHPGVMACIQPAEKVRIPGATTAGAIPTSSNPSAGLRP